MSDQVRRGRDGDGPYYRWGETGKRYHYTANDPKSRAAARRKAEKQETAAHARTFGGGS